MPGENSGNPYGYTPPRQSSGGNRGKSRRSEPRTAPGANRQRQANGGMWDKIKRATQDAVVSGASGAARRNSGGGGGSSGGGYGGGYGGGGMAAVAAAPPPPPPMSVTDWLAKDTAYQSQESALKKALTDYVAQMGKNKTNYETDYTARSDDLAINKTRSMDDQKNDFASRGLLFSGLYGQDVSKLTNDFARRTSDMERARSTFLDDLSTNFANFKDQQELTQTKAKQDALARRAAEYGL